MIRKVISLLLSLGLLVALAISASASQNLPLVVDQAELLDSAEEAALETMALELRAEYHMDIVILTVDTLSGKSAQMYADEYYDAHGYGYDDDGTGPMFLLAMAEREWYISTCGNAIYALTDYEIQQIGDTVVWYLSDGNYHAAFQAFLTEIPGYLNSYDAGGYTGNSGYDHPVTQGPSVHYKQPHSPNILVSLAIGIVAALVVILIMRYFMNTKRRQHGASGYLKAGSFHLRGHQDLFQYSNVSKVRRQQNNSSGSRSSVHRSSSGRRHGGGGGRF